MHLLLYHCKNGATCQRLIHSKSQSEATSLAPLSGTRGSRDRKGMARPLAEESRGCRQEDPQSMNKRGNLLRYRTKEEVQEGGWVWKT